MSVLPCSEATRTVSSSWPQDNESCRSAVCVLSRRRTAPVASREKRHPDTAPDPTDAENFSFFLLPSLLCFIFELVFYFSCIFELYFSPGVVQANTRYEGMLCFNNRFVVPQLVCPLQKNCLFPNNCFPLNLISWIMTISANGLDAKHQMGLVAGCSYLVDTCNSRCWAQDDMRYSVYAKVHGFSQ